MELLPLLVFIQISASPPQAILDVVVNLQFGLIEKLWQTFWRYSPPDSVEGATVTENRSDQHLYDLDTFDGSSLDDSSYRFPLLPQQH